MKNLMISVSLTLFAAPVFAVDYGTEQINQIYDNESSGLRYYERGDYGKAFNLLGNTAALGMKRSQYILGFMFLKGEGVDKNMLFGFAWMGLATESGNDEWQATYDGLYSSLSDAQKSMVDDKTNEYRKLFGATAQGITCSRRAIGASRRVDWVCLKSEGSYVVHEIELPIRAQ
jgi:TPR repeat protein